MVLQMQWLIGILWFLAASLGQESHPTTIHLIGDSTMAGKPLEGNPERGWGQAFPFFPDHDIKASPAVAIGQPGRYLFAYFVANGQDGLHLAFSEDGLTWRELNGYRSRIVPQVGADKLMRDPFILKGPDGMFHMVWTVSWKEKGIGYASSKDLLSWSEQKYLPVMEHEPAARNCWAPEMVYDDEKAQYLIFWATTIPGRFPQTDGQNSKGPGDPGLNHRLYCVTSKDMQTFTPTRLFFDQGFNVIDATIIRNGAKYLLFLKDETNAPFIPEKNIRWTSADHAEGPYPPVSGPITGQFWCEGPSVLRIGEDWVVYFDRYREGRYGAVVSSDLKTWKDFSHRLKFPDGARHGTVFRVSEPVWTGLMALK